MVGITVASRGRTIEPTSMYSAYQMYLQLVACHHPTLSVFKVHEHVLAQINVGEDQPDFRGPRPAGRGWDTHNIGRVATCRILHEIYSNVHEFATC